MPIERKTVERSLRQKGFVAAEHSKHRYFHHMVGGKQTGMWTFVSRGTTYRTIGDSLLGSMKRQLGLDSTRQVHDLLECPMSGDQYNSHLFVKGLIKNTPTGLPKPKGKSRQ